MDTVYILLPVHNRKRVTEQFVNCLKKQTYTNYHLILIDDGSTDGTSEMVKENIKNLTIIRGKGNWWWGGSLHQGYMYLKKQTTHKNDVVLIMNDDTSFDDKFIENGIKIIKNKRNILLQAEAHDIHSDYIEKGGILDISNFSFRISNDNKFNYLSSRGLMIKLVSFLDIGSFYPKLIPHYASDTEYTYRAYKKGYYLSTDSSFKLKFNSKTTGITKGKGFISLFSKSNKDNPIPYIFFILLHSPLIYKPFHIIRILKRKIF